MKPGSFDPATAREVVGDTEARKIEAKARAAADAGRFDKPDERGAPDDSYQWLVYLAMCAVVYRTQHTKRTARNKRKAAA